MWITASNGGYEITALSKASSLPISSTSSKSSLFLGVLGWAALILSILDCERTVVTTEWPFSKSTSSTCDATKPLPPGKFWSIYGPRCLVYSWELPVRRTRVILACDVGIRRKWCRRGEEYYDGGTCNEN